MRTVVHASANALQQLRGSLTVRPQIIHDVTGQSNINSQRMFAHKLLNPTPANQLADDVNMAYQHISNTSQRGCPQNKSLSPIQHDITSLAHITLAIQA